MIKFSCKCGKNYNVEEKYAGKNVRCKKCNNFIIVPQNKTSDKKLSAIGNHQVSEYNQTTMTIPPKLVLGFFSIVGLLLVFFLIWFYFLRDTWERDNYNRIYEMSSQADSKIVAKDFYAALDIYEDILTILGNRKIKSPPFIQKSENIKCSFENTKKACNKWENELIRNWMKSIEPDMNNVRTFSNSKKYNEAIKICKSILLKERPHIRNKQEEINVAISSVNNLMALAEKGVIQVAEEKKAAEEAKKKAEAERIEAEKKAKIAHELEIQEKRKQEKAAKEAQLLAKEEERGRLNEERISNGYLYPQEMADTIIKSLLDNRTLVQASLATSNIPQMLDYSIPGNKAYPPKCAEFVYAVEYWTQGGLYRKGQCDIALNPIILPDDIAKKYKLQVTWEIRYVYVDGTLVGF
ncbi:MAG: hypothetical protein A2Y10_01365 [Planctomycetes bacterium GWF2_41_51]|nr:MAG: hypothetical protein A2Y10_01365 [Planctomycetes bacterium GWF2_41_51]HBG26724.1 hypothetical protein [Phycisphaerales bacterium]